MVPHSHSDHYISAKLGLERVHREAAVRALALKNAWGDLSHSMRTTLKNFSGRSFVWCVALAVAVGVVTKVATAQDYDDPPARVARIGLLQGSVSFQPAGESDWVGAVPNRPMTTGDQLWSDVDSRAEVQLGSAVIRLSAMTGFSFLNLDDSTVQIQLTAGALNLTVRRLGQDEDFEIDTPNQAFNIFQPGHYRIEASADGNYTIVSVRAGEGESTGGGQTYDLRAGQQGTFSGTDQLYAEVTDVSAPDDFDNWSQNRDHRYDYSHSAQYLSPYVVGFDDLDDYGNWQFDATYGHVWYPSVVDSGWAPYHTGHWDWISPWGWTWVDDSPWGYAPFHYGRWSYIGGRWGWIAGPTAQPAVYAPALVVFVGGGPGGWGGNVGWFPLGPREVYVPSYHVSEAYVTRVNVSSTTVNVTEVTNVYRTTIVNNTTTVTNITYANRSVSGAVTAVPQAAFTSAQPVAKVAVKVSAQQIAAAPMTARVAVAPTRASVLGAKAASAGHVTAPPAAVAARQVVAKKSPPPPPVSFAKQQQALAAHPGEPVAKSQMQALRPAAAARPAVKVAPPGKPATAAVGRPGGQPGAARPGQPATAPSNGRPANQPMNQPAPGNRAPTPVPNQPAPANNRPEPAQPNRAQPQPNQPMRTAPPAAERPQPKPAEPAPRAQPAPAERPQPNRPAPEENRPAPRPAAPAAEKPQQQRTPPPAAKPAPAPKQQTPAQKKQEEEEKKKEQKPNG